MKNSLLYEIILFKKNVSLQNNFFSLSLIIFVLIFVFFFLGYKNIIILARNIASRSPFYHFRKKKLWQTDSWADSSIH